jgi:hypothetical protein
VRIEELALAGAAILAGGDWALGVALVWVAHIGVERAIGHALEHPRVPGDAPAAAPSSEAHASAAHVPVDVAPGLHAVCEDGDGREEEMLAHRG